MWVPQRGPADFAWYVQRGARAETSKQQLPGSPGRLVSVPVSQQSLYLIALPRHLLGWWEGCPHTSGCFPPAGAALVQIMPSSHQGRGNQGPGLSPEACGHRWPSGCITRPGHEAAGGCGACYLGAGTKSGWFPQLLRPSPV